MRHIKPGLSALSVLLISAALWGCDPLGGATQPSVKPSEATSVSGALGAVLRVVTESSPSSGSVTATIGAAGGRLALGQHVLEVPAGAVTAPTVFTMTKRQTDRLVVDLTATVSSANDVGSKGFAQPVRLTLSYANADPLSLPSNLLLLRVAWARPDGTLDAQPTTVDLAGQTVSASLRHFSDYAVATQ